MTQATRLVSAFLRLNGDGSEDMTAAIGDYSYSPSGDSAYITRLLILGSRNGTLSADDYVGGQPLAVGLRLLVADADGGERVVLTPQPVQSSVHWAQYCYDVQPLDFGGGQNSIVVRWTFARSGGFLELNSGESLVMQVQDDMGNLTRHTALVQGFLGSMHRAIRSNSA